MKCGCVFCIQNKTCTYWYLAIEFGICSTDRAFQLLNSCLRLEECCSDRFHAGLGDSECGKALLFVINSLHGRAHRGKQAAANGTRNSKHKSQPVFLKLKVFFSCNQLVPCISQRVLDQTIGRVALL